MLLKVPKVNLNEARAEMCRRSFFYFVQQFWETIIAEEPVWNWHIEYLCDELQEIVERIALKDRGGVDEDGNPKKERASKLHDLIINIPPGSSKSTIVSQMLPAWAWTIDPTIRTIGSSHSKTVSIDQAEKCRMIIQSPKYERLFPNLKILHTTEAKSHFKNNHNGERYATSVGESRIGIHAHLIIVDDPLNPKEATSEADRLTANKHITQTLSTRKVDKRVTVTILIMQRLHENDPTGHLLAKKKSNLKHICLPAEDSKDVKPAELRERYVDGLLDPVRLDRESLKEAKEDLGSYGYAGQFKQQPADDAGGIIKRAWFGKCKLEQLVMKSMELNEQLVYHFWVDGAYTEDLENDPTGLMCACKLGNMAYILDASKAYKEFPDLIPHIKAYVNRIGYEPSSKVYVEPKATGKSIVQQMKRSTDLNIIEDESPTDSKVVRAHAAAPNIEAGRVVLVEGDWNDAFLDEVTTFPRAAHDEHVDNLTAMVRRFFGKKGSGKATYSKSR